MWDSSREGKWNKIPIHSREVNTCRYIYVLYHKVWFNLGKQTGNIGWVFQFHNKGDTSI